jgi:hypothetical protein
MVAHVDADNGACVHENESLEAGDTMKDHKPAASSMFLVEESRRVQPDRSQALNVKRDPAYSCGEH